MASLRDARAVNSPADDGSPRDTVGEIAQRRDRMQATLDELERVAALDDTGDGRWREAAVGAVAQASATWERHVVGTEAPGGILADVLGREPRLAHLVDTLRDDHRGIRSLLERATAGLPTQDPATARREVQALAERLSRHHRLGAELLHSTYEVDLGGSG